MIFQQQFKGTTPVPAIYSSRESVEAGGLMSYGQSLTDAHRQIGVEIVWRPVSWGYDLVERSLVRADETMNIQEIMNPAVHPGYETPSIFAVICDNYFIEAGGHAYKSS